MSKMPETMPLVENTILIRNIEKENQEIKNKIANLRKTLLLLKEDFQGAASTKLRFHLGYVLRNIVRSTLQCQTMS